MDRYGSDVLSQNPHRKTAPVIPTVPAEFGLMVECAETGFYGSVVRTEKDIDGRTVELVDFDGMRRVFLMEVGAFLIDDEPVTLVAPNTVPSTTTRTASGSFTSSHSRAQVARESRIWVEGIHDAELVERIWGEDLRRVAVVVEPLHGADDLVRLLADFDPEPTRKVGVLLDHMVPHSKETLIAEQAIAEFAPFVHVIGHPFVDIWQAVKPESVGISEWPVIPKGQPWKAGVIASLGWDLDDRQAWKKILSSVNHYTDLESSLLGRVEELIDFVTADE